jgi:hypothetical protein
MMLSSTIDKFFKSDLGFFDDVEEGKTKQKQKKVL